MPLCAVLLAASLAACQMTGNYDSYRSVPMLDGAINIGVPPGYCIDTQGSRTSDSSAVILMGRCNDAVGALPALITVSVGQGGSAGVMTAGGAALTEFFSSRQGLATLSRDGRAGSVKILKASSLGDAYLMFLRDRAVGDYWRAIVGIEGRLVAISATGTDDIVLQPDDSRKLVESVLAAMQRANPG